MKVRVYYNLHKKTWSVQKYIKGKGWRIWIHTDKVLLNNAEFKVYESGREKVRQEKKKNVHAYVIGNFDTMSNLGKIMTEESARKTLDNKVYYNPYKVDQFQLNNEPIYKADYVWMENRRVYV